jgi:hypothetical protein
MRARTTRLMAGLALVFALGLGGQAQEPRAEQPQAQQPADMSARCKAMMAEHGKMMEEMKAADQRIDQLVAKMNQASGQAKVDAVAETVTEMVSQRRAMHARMTEMQGRMMSHAMEHMQAGPGSAAACPMMKMHGMRQ